LLDFAAVRCDSASSGTRLSKPGDCRVDTLVVEQRMSVARVKDGVETRERLLQAAIDLYSANGFSGGSVDDVVRRAGVTKGAFYHHFESKAHLIMAIHNRFVDRQINDITAIIEKGLAPPETLTEAIVVIFGNMIKHKESISLFIREYPAMPSEVDRAVRDRRIEYERLLVGVIDRGRDLGVFYSELPSNILLYGILGMCAWATQWYDPKRAPSPEVVGRNYARMVINGIAAPNEDLESTSMIETHSDQRS
jgi:AcrR family transcriptional regulator